jgi:hypothetical protein
MLLVERASGAISIKTARGVLQREFEQERATRRWVVVGGHGQYAYRRIPAKAGKHVVI